MRGTHGGKAYAVYKDDKLISRISGHASYGALAVTRAEAELRRQGCPLPRRDVTKKKEVEMPRLTADEEARMPALRTQIQTAEAEMGRAALIERAVNLIAVGAHEGAIIGLDDGNLTPAENLETALHRLLDENKGWKQTNIDRWSYVVERLHETNGGSVAHDEAEPPAPTLDTDTVDVLQAAEEMVQAAEAERDVQKQRVTELEKQVENQEKALGLLTESKDGRIAELEAVVESQRRTIDEHVKPADPDLDAQIEAGLLHALELGPMTGAKIRRLAPWLEEALAIRKL